MKVKNSIKKVGAVAGSALMVGLTMGSAATLGDYPQPFVGDDGDVASQIVVGSSGKVADVVGAVNIAAGLGQAAVQTETREAPGGTSADVDGAEYDVAIRATSTGDEWVDKSSYSPLMRESVEDSDGNDHRVLERIGIDASNEGEEVSNSVNGTDVVASVDQGALEYTISYTPGFSDGQSIPVLDENYEVTAVTQDADDNNVVELGSKEVQEGLQLDDSYEHGPYTITVIDKDETGSGQIYLQIDKDGSTLTSFGLETGDSKAVDNGALEVTADEVFFGSRSDYIDVTSVYTDTEVVQGEDSPFDEDYTVKSLTGSNFANGFSNGTVTGLTLESDLFTDPNPANNDDEDAVEQLTAGDVFAGPSDYFDLHYLGLTDETMEELTVNQDMTVSFSDTLGVSHNVDAQELALDDADADALAAGNGVLYDDDDGGDSAGETTWSPGTYYVDVSGQTVQVDITEETAGASGSQVVTVTASYENWEDSVTVDFEADSGTVLDVSTGYGFDFTMSINSQGGSATGNTLYDLEVANQATSLETEYGHTWTWADSGSDNPEVQINENGGSTNYVHFGGTEGIESVDDNGSGADDGEWFLDSEGDETRSEHGTVVEVGSDAESASFNVPEESLDVQFALGSTDVTQTSGDTYEAFAGAQALPDMAQLDSEVTESVRSNNHLILVGGPAVNTLVDDLGDAVDLSDVADAESGAVLQVVNDAFTSGQHALVVAGYGADDTRNAARYLSNHADHESALDDAGERLVLTEADYPSAQ